MPLSPTAYALLGLTAIVAALVAALVFAVLRFTAAARDTRRSRHSGAGEAALLSAALQDAVARLKAAERAAATRAEASERLSSEIIASLTAGLLVVDLDGSVQILNPAGRRMLGLPDPLPSADFRRAIGASALADVVGECLSSGVPIVRRTVAVDLPASRVSHLGVTVSPMFDESGAPHGAICLFSDLTAVNALEEQLRLKESLAAVGELTAGIAHEFRNGLATIHGYSRLFDLDTLPEQHRTYVNGIRAEAEALGEVVTNFLNFAKPAQLTLVRVELEPVCTRAAEELRADARARGGDITVRGRFGAVDGDEVLLRQAFSNLLRNAVDACTGAGLAPVVVVEGTANATARQVRVTVDDNGPGIALEARDRIFKPFVTSKRQGTGLGLALVQKIVVFHNGRVTAGPSPLGGARLEIVLPLAG